MVKQKLARASQERNTINQRLRAEIVFDGFSFSLVCLGDRQRLIFLAISLLFIAEFVSFQKFISW